MHNGIDFKAPISTPIYASATGKIIFAKYDNKYGNHIVAEYLFKEMFGDSL